MFLLFFVFFLALSVFFAYKTLSPATECRKSAKQKVDDFENRQRSKHGLQ
jgi:hypothetical protein